MSNFSRCTTLRLPILTQPMHLHNSLHKVSCTCSNSSVQDHVEAQPLPHASKNFLIFEQNNDVYVKTQIGSAIQVHVLSENFKMTRLQHISTCQVQTSELTGCYSCSTGASLSLLCTSDNDEVLANINCDKHNHVIKCTETGYLNKIFFMSGNPE